MAFLAGVVLEHGGLSAVVRYIAAQTAGLAKPGDGAVNSGLADFKSLLMKSMIGVFGRHAVFRTGREQFLNGFLLLGLISAALRHREHSLK